jgi:hypothetical protein
LAFHPYPQVIPPVCNPDGFGPPRACSARFTLPKGRSPSFGSVARHLPPFRTRVRSGSGCPCLNLATNNHSSAHSTKGTPSPSEKGSDRLEAHGFRLSFTPLAGVLFTVPSRYWFPIGRCAYLALGRGRPGFPPDSACRMVLTQMQHPLAVRTAYGTLTPSGRPFQCRSAPDCTQGEDGGPSSLHPVLPRSSSASPLGTLNRFGLLPFRSPLLRESSLFLAVLRCFSSRGLPTTIPAVSPRCRGGVAPFGNPWITRCQHVPRAFRGVAASFIGTQRLGIHRALIIVDSLATTGREHPAPRREAGPRLRHTSSCPGLPRVCCPQWSRGDSNPGPPPCKGGALPAKLRPPLAPGAPGGRAWTRTRDLGLIRTALSPPELRARRPSAPKTECSPNLPIRSIPRIGPARVRPWVTPSPPSTPRCPPRLTTDRLTTPGHP